MNTDISLQMNRVVVFGGQLVFCELSNKTFASMWIYFIFASYEAHIPWMNVLLVFQRKNHFVVSTDWLNPWAVCGADGLSSFPAAVTWRGTGRAALTGGSQEGARVSAGAQPDEKAALVHCNGRRSRRVNRIKLQLLIVKIRGFGFVLGKSWEENVWGWLLGEQAVISGEVLCSSSHSLWRLIAAQIVPVPLWNNLGRQESPLHRHGYFGMQTIFWDAFFHLSGHVFGWYGDVGHALFFFLLRQLWKWQRFIYLC